MKSFYKYSFLVVSLFTVATLTGCGNQQNPNTIGNQQALNNGYYNNGVWGNQGWGNQGWGNTGWGNQGWGNQWNNGYTMGCGNGTSTPINGGYRCRVAIVPAYGYVQGGYYSASGQYNAGDRLIFNLNGARISSNGMGAGAFFNVSVWGGGWGNGWGNQGWGNQGGVVVSSSQFQVVGTNGQVGNGQVMQNSGTISIVASNLSCSYGTIMFQGVGAVEAERCISNNNQPMNCP